MATSATRGTQYPHIYPGEDLGVFNFFEASSIRKVGNKYVSIYSGYSGPDYGLASSNSTCVMLIVTRHWDRGKAAAYWSTRALSVLNRDGTALQTSNGGHNTHGSIEEINGQWYVFYHRPPRGFGYARQPMVAPIKVEFDERPVAEGGKVTIRAFDPYANDGLWTARDSKATNTGEPKSPRRDSISTARPLPILFGGIRMLPFQQQHHAGFLGHLG